MFVSKIGSNILKISTVNSCVFFHLHRFYSIFNNVNSYSVVHSIRMHLRKFHEVDTKDIPNVSLSQMKRFLEANGLKVTDGYACLITSCNLCSNQAKESKLFVNKVTGFYLCNSCHASGQWKSLHNYISSANSEKNKKVLQPNSASNSVNSKWLHLCEKSKTLLSLAADDRDKIISVFNFNGLSKETIADLNILVDSTNKTLFFPLKNVFGSVIGFKELNHTGEEITVPSNNCFGVIKLPGNDQSSSKTDNTAVVVHTVKDLLALSFYKLNCHKICLPNGLLNLPQELLPLFEQYTKIVLWFGNDTASWDSAKSFAKKLGEQRCYFVRSVEKQPAPHKAHALNLNITDIIKSAQPIWHSCITTFAALRKDLLAELQNTDNTQGVKWQRFPVLNKILKGHRRGELTIITGPTGCGKTTFMSEYSLDLSMQGVTTLWGSFEIRNHRLARTMLQQFSMLPLEKNLKDFDFWADRFERLPIYFLTFYGQQNLRDVMEAVEHATYVNDIAHVIIDNVQFMLGLSDRENQFIDRFYRQDLIIAAFRSFATKRNCHVTLVIHPRKERDAEQLTTNSIFGSAKASQEADNILIMQQKNSQSIELQKFLQITKNRFSGDLGLMPLDFHQDSRSFSKFRKEEQERI